jgi:hypothetical protein
MRYKIKFLVIFYVDFVHVKVQFEKCQREN